MRRLWLCVLLCLPLRLWAGAVMWGVLPAQDPSAPVAIQAQTVLPCHPPPAGEPGADESVEHKTCQTCQLCYLPALPVMSGGALPDVPVAERGSETDAAFVSVDIPPRLKPPRASSSFMA